MSTNVGIKVKTSSFLSFTQKESSSFLLSPTSSPRTFLRDSPDKRGSVENRWVLLEKGRVFRVAKIPSILYKDSVNILGRRNGGILPMPRWRIFIVSFVIYWQSCEMLRKMEQRFIVGML